jgi:photosystem II stability/assembly factor-like uncharacterized protein
LKKRTLRAGILTLMFCFCAMLAGEETPPSWKPIGWGGGGFYWACAFHPTKDGVIYLGGDCNGVYKSEDHGKHWHIINRGLSDYAVYSLAVDACHPDTVYAGTTSGVCKSTDAGEHWEFLEATGLKAQAIFADRGQSVHALAIDPASGEILAGTPRGLIYKSANGGKEWKKIYELKEKGDIASVAYSTKSGRLMLAASSNAGLLKSSDGGETWTELATPKSVRHAAFAPSDDSLIYAACGKDGVWKSADQGQTWKAQSGIDAKSVINDLVIDPKNPDIVCAMATTGWSGNVYRTADGGKTWSNVGGLKTDPQTDPTLPLEGSNGHVGFSTLTNIALNPNNSAELFISANWRNAYSADSGQTWEERNCGCDISCVTDIRFFDGKTYVTVMDEGLFESEDNGASWKQLFPLKYTAGVSGHHWRIDASKSPDGAIRIISACSPWDSPVNKILISSDSGKTFKPFSDGFPKERPKKNTMWGDGYVRALAVDPNDSQIVYAGSMATRIRRRTLPAAGSSNQSTVDRPGSSLNTSLAAAGCSTDCVSIPLIRNAFSGARAGLTEGSIALKTAANRGLWSSKMKPGSSTWLLLPMESCTAVGATSGKAPTRARAGKRFPISKMAARCSA